MKNEIIEEMAKVIHGYCEAECLDGCYGCIPYENAEKLYNAGYRKQSDEKGGEWISVEDKMPKINTDVIICHGGYIGHFLDVYTYLGNDAWEDSYGYWHRTDDICITHWMPLPEAPKGGE